MNDSQQTDRIEQRLEHLSSAVRELAATLDSVTAALSPVLRQQQEAIIGVDEPSKAQANNGSNGSTVNTMIMKETNDIWACVDKLRAIGSRIDL